MGRLRGVPLGRVLGVAMVALAASFAVLATSPALVAGHAQLVSSTPGSGALVATAPTEARLVFSEPAEPGYASVDLLDGRGAVMGIRLGTLDASDPRTLVVPLPALADGAYSLAWRAVSAADGHSTSGFVRFAVGTTPLPEGVGAYDPGSGGDIHSGHSGTTALAETQGRAGSYLGSMLAFGFALLAAVVVAPVFGRVPAALVFGQAAALLVAGFGSALLGLVAGEAFTTGEEPSASALGSLAYLVESRTGLLILGRILIAIPAAIVVFLLARSRPRLALTVGGVAAAGCIALTSAGSHAAAFGSLAPIAAQAFHIAGASVWLSGIVLLAAGVLARGFSREQVPQLVRRFSALALVAIGLLSATGIYSVWVETGQLLSLDTDYGRVLAVKIALFVLAIGIGALNYLEAPRALVERMPFVQRVSAEAVLGVAIVVATALLASGSPPAGIRPVELAPAAATAAASSGGVASDVAGLGVQPARPGPNRFTARLDDEPPPGARAELRLQRLDVDEGTTVLELVRAEGTDAVYGTAGGDLPRDSRWDATVVVHDANGLELGRSRFAFALDATAVSEGRLLPPIDPALAVAIALIALGVLALSYALAGGRLPRTDAAASRVSMLAGGAAAMVVGTIMTFGGPRP